jgi:hypothetical protein
MIRSGRVPTWIPAASVVLLAVGASFTALPNKFVQDDAGIIQTVAEMHSLAHPLRFFAESYWQDPYPHDLYRPLTKLALAAQWVIGDGRPVVFRVVSILMYIGASLAILALARRLLSPAAAWLSAALFAVHPVHVEAVAAAVNQAELVVAALLAVLTTAYIDRRRAGRSLTSGWIAAVVAVYVIAALFKEHALMLPAFLGCAELTVIADARPWRERVAALRPFYLILLLVGVVFIAVRRDVLGDTTGTFAAEAFHSASMGGRALTMLGVVPRMVQLFVWPSHLQADYSPQEIVAATHWGAAQTLGAALLIGCVVLGWWCRRRKPVITFALLWTAVALFPVSNVLIPTGIVLAERTLFLASLGVVLVEGDVLATAGRWIYQRGRVGRLVAAAGVAVILALGVTRSALREMAWHDLFTFWSQAVIDAPRSYRAHFAYASVLFDLKLKRTAEYEFKRTLALYPRAWPADLALADHYREAGFCDPAVGFYEKVLQAAPQHTAARSSLIACLVYDGDYARAVRLARLGVSFGVQPKTFRDYWRIADSAAAAHAPVHSVTLPPPIDAPPTNP